MHSHIATAGFTLYRTADNVGPWLTEWYHFNRLLLVNFRNTGCWTSASDFYLQQMDVLRSGNVPTACVCSLSSPLCVVYWLINSEWSFIFKGCNYTGELHKDRGVAVIYMHFFKHTSGSGCVLVCVCVFSYSGYWQSPIYSCGWPKPSHHMP